MGIWDYIKGVFSATWSGIRHLFRPRMTLRYPEQKLDLEGPGYKYDAKQGVGLPGFKGRHILKFEKCTGCQLCAIACDGVAVAIEMQKVPKTKPQNKKDIWPAVDYGRCVPAGTPIVTSLGILPIEQVKTGDKVLTHKGNFKEVTEVFSRKYTGRLYTFKTLGNAEKLSVTEEHPILVYSGGTTKWAYPSAIGYRTYLTRPIIAETQEIPSLTYTYELYHPSGRGGYFTIETVSLQFKLELARIIGYYLSEGNCDRYRVSFDINQNEQSTLGADIASCVKSVFGEEVAFKPDKRSKGLKIVVDSVRAAAFFKQFGAMCDKKVLPPWALTAPRELQAEIIKTGYWGDGHYSNKFYSYKHAMHSNYFIIRTTSRTLANQYTYILGRLGILSSISVNKQRDRKDCYSVTIHSPYVDRMGKLVDVQSENSPSYSHSYVKMVDGMIVSPVVSASGQSVAGLDVYNLEVKDDNSYVSSNISVHNCVFCGLCIDPETEIQTNPGLKQINQIAIGELVLTHTGDYKPVTKIWDMSYTGPMYRIYAYGKPEPLVCTADHQVIAVSRPISNRKDKRLLRVTAPLLFHKPAELKPGDYVVSPIVRKVVPVERFEKDVQMYKGGRTTRRLSLEASPDLFRLIGYYYAEGSCDGGRRVNFDFNVTERETYAGDCARLTKEFFGKEVKIRKNGEHGVRLVLDSALAEDFFSQFGKGAPNKKMPDWVFFAEPAKQAQLLKGEWQGDGCRVNQARQKYLNITTTSKVLAYQLQSVYARLGVVSTIDTEKMQNRLRSYHVNVFGRWALKVAKMWDIDFDYAPTKHADKFHIDERFVYSPIRRIEIEQVQDHRVMDVTVQDDHTFAPLGIATSNCVDACPFDALDMTNEYELSSYDKESLKYTPDMLAVPPKLEGRKYKVEFDTEKGIVKHD